ncbi:MAG: SDR family NAD(P)-dependent oxidoreductase [Halioglobus sp.]|nr:SDR family NAD(P)-dependent oxidoreductase [Halioglobus sp.]
MEEFKGKLAVITGAASGIGKALARRCVAEGMNVAIADLYLKGLSELAAELESQGASVLALEVDVSDAASVQALADRSVEALGPVSLLFNNAGILRVGQAWTHTAQQWQAMLSVNVMGVVNGINAFVPGMMAAGVPAHIVNTGSVGSLVAAPNMAQYTACKMAVRGITESLAYDLAAAGADIDVSLLCPGPVSTPIGDSLLGLEAGSEESEANVKMMEELPDFITSDECARRVFAAIRARKFWIFTHPFTGYYKRATAAIVDGDNPVYTEVEFDPVTH